MKRLPLALNMEGLMTDSKHGGARPGAGRPTIDKETPPVKYLIVVTAAQREKIDANGGAPWVRGLIDAAPVAKPAKKP